MKRVIALAFTVALAIAVVTAGSIRAAGPEQDKPADEATALAVKLTEQGAQGRFILRLVLTGTQVTTFARPIPRRCGTRHLPSAIPDSDFGDPASGPLCRRDILRNATFFGFFENLGNHIFDASS